MKTKTLKTRHSGPAAPRGRTQAAVSAMIPGVRTAELESPDVPQRKESPALWGLLTSIDIHNCDPASIRDADLIKRFVAELCDLIEMRRFGETLVVHFGEEERVAGYSMVQLIETSLISAHFANASNAIYLDVFSCKMYDPEVVADFARKYFGGARCITHVTPRY
jgi:S-adenosylmethionine/arginine decarboxylase-like enzyme